MKILPLTANRWPDLAKLFGKRGACGGCWCMYFRLPQAQWISGKGAGNRKALRQLVKSGETPGLLAYVEGEPAGWCALSPREHYPRLASSRNYQPLDARPVWSITCFFVARPFRRQGVTLALTKAAVAFAARHGAEIVEAYPSEPKKGYSDVFYYRGLISTFRRAGFKEAARRTPSSPMMRRIIEK